MPLQVKNTGDFLDPSKYRMKLLIYGISGTGKTKFLGTAAEVGALGVAACETGLGSGTSTIAESRIPFVEPTSFQEFYDLATGKDPFFKDKAVMGLDSLSEMVKTFITKEALKIPRMRGESEKRKKGIPELDDYGTIGAMTRELLRILISNHPSSHLVVTATEKHKDPDPEAGRHEGFIAPDLAGEMALGAPAMFDLVLRLRTRPALRDPRDPKSRYTQRYFITQADGVGSIVKCRPNTNTKPFLAPEEIFDPTTGQGTFKYLLDKILRGYEAAGTVVA